MRHDLKPGAGQRVVLAVEIERGGDGESSAGDRRTPIRLVDRSLAPRGKVNAIKGSAGDGITGARMQREPPVDLDGALLVLGNTQDLDGERGHGGVFADVSAP